MLGPDLLVAPVFSDAGRRRVLPAGRHLDELVHRRARDRTRLAARVATGSTPCRSTSATARCSRSARRDDRPDHDHLDGLVIEVYPSSDPSPGPVEVEVVSPTGGSATFTVERSAGRVTARATAGRPSGSWSLRAPGGATVPAAGGHAEIVTPR